MTEEHNWVRIERDFDAPIDLVWRMWTEPALFKQWYGPNGMSVPSAERDLKVGGTRKVCMRMQSPYRSMGMPDGFPDVTEVIVDLTEVDGKTRMVMVHVGVGEGTAGAGGWTQAFDKLAALVKASTDPSC